MKELDKYELKQVDGGIWVKIAEWVALGILWDTLNDPKSAGRSFKEGLLAE